MNRQNNLLFFFVIYQTSNNEKQISKLCIFLDWQIHLATLSEVYRVWNDIGSHGHEAVVNGSALTS